MSTKKGSGDPEVGARIRAIRKAKSWSLNRLASEAGLDQPNLSKLENGHVGFSADSIRRIARALDVPVSDLFRSGSPGPVCWVPFRNQPERPLFPSGLPVSRQAFALEVSDNALAPLIQIGDFIICDGTPWSDGRAVVAEHGKGLIVRKVRTLVPAKYAEPQIRLDQNGGDEQVWELQQDSVWELYADSDLLPRIEVSRDSECQIIGTVVQRITRMLQIPRTVFVNKRTA